LIGDLVEAQLFQSAFSGMIRTWFAHGPKRQIFDLYAQFMIFLALSSWGAIKVLSEFKLISCCSEMKWKYVLASSIQTAVIGAARLTLACFLAYGSMPKDGSVQSN
jgi:hypothetical protein